MECARSHFEVVRLQDHAALARPERLQRLYKFLERFHAIRGLRRRPQNLQTPTPEGKRSAVAENLFGFARIVGLTVVQNEARKQRERGVGRLAHLEDDALRRRTGPGPQWKNGDTAGRQMFKRFVEAIGANDHSHRSIGPHALHRGREPSSEPARIPQCERTRIIRRHLSGRIMKWRIAEHVVELPPQFLRQIDCVCMKEFEALFQIVDTRVFSCLLDKFFQNFDADYPTARNARGKAQACNASAAAELEHLIALLCWHCGGKHDGIGSGSEPAARLSRPDPSAQKPVLGLCVQVPDTA